MQLQVSKVYLELHGTEPHNTEPASNRTLHHLKMDDITRVPQRTNLVWQLCKVVNTIDTLCNIRIGFDVEEYRFLCDEFCNLVTLFYSEETQVLSLHKGYHRVCSMREVNISRSSFSISSSRPSKGV